MAEKEAKAFSSKKMLQELGKKGEKIKFTDRKKVEITQDTQFYKKGQVVNPHRVKAEALISQGFAKEVK